MPNTPISTQLSPSNRDAVMQAIAPQNRSPLLMSQT